MNIGRYQVVRLLGQGGMASVYEATESALNRRVAIKVLHSNMSNDPEVIARFVSEGRIVNGIRHPSLVPVHEQGQLPDRSYYIVMDLLEGETLSRRMARSVHRPMSMEEALRIVRQVAEALATVHRHGVVHRDIKPDNLMLIPDPAVLGGVRVKILDFGLAKAPRVRAVGEHINTVIGCAYGTVQAFLFYRRCTVLRQRCLGIGKGGRQVGRGRDGKRAGRYERTFTPHQNGSQSGGPSSLGLAP